VGRWIESLTFFHFLVFEDVLASTAEPTKGIEMKRESWQCVHVAGDWANYECCLVIYSSLSPPLPGLLAV
jgi:hypothetical protein